MLVQNKIKDPFSSRVIQTILTQSQIPKHVIFLAYNTYKNVNPKSNGKNVRNIRKRKE